MRAVAHCDGGSRGNPGPAACATVIEFDNGLIVRETQYLGNDTVNSAEYKGLILTLLTARDEGVTDIEIRMDSKLVVEQVVGAWSIKDSRMQQLADEAASIAKGFDSVKIKHVPRDQNEAADAIVAKILNARTGRKRR